MARILRGEVYWADLNPVRGREQAGLRPVFILSHDLFNRKSETVIAMAITSQAQKAGFPLTIAFPSDNDAQTLMGEDLADSDNFHRSSWQEDRGPRS